MILIGLGSSLSFWGQSPPAIISCAVHALSSLGKVTAASRLYESPAWPDPSDPVFFNACAAVETDLPPAAVLAGLSAIEAAFGRRRTKPNGPRTLDIDLLDYQGFSINDPGPPPLELPHPRLGRRDFVLLPLRDIAADWRHPVLGTPLETMIADLGATTAKPIGPQRLLLR